MGTDVPATRPAAKEANIQVSARMRVGRGRAIAGGDEQRGPILVKGRWFAERVATAGGSKQGGEVAG